MRAVVWVELRCYLQNELTCHEGGEGGWCSTARDIDELIKAHQNIGWVVKDKGTICPACAKGDAT